MQKCLTKIIWDVTSGDTKLICRFAGPTDPDLSNIEIKIIFFFINSSHPASLSV